MSANRYFDTVAFDVRDETSMLFFARTSQVGDIEDYLLVIRADSAASGEGVYLEVNEQLLAGHDLIREARLTGNILTVALREPAAALDDATEIVLTFDDTEENRTSMESGAFRVFGNLLTGGNA
jgi:hypothetical protein